MNGPSGTSTLQLEAVAARHGAGDTLARRYRLVYRIDSGGMGSVWEARDLLLGRRVAIKIPRAGRISDADRRRVLSEARLAARVAHPRVVSVFDLGVDGGVPFVVMELVEGTALDRVLRERSVDPREGAWIAADVAEAVAAVHRCGVVHGDVKPGNVILSADGRPKLADLGVASLVSDEAGRADPGSEPAARFGTRPYTAPEVVDGEQPSAPSDVFALGVTLRELADAITPRVDPAPADGEHDPPGSAVLAGLSHAGERATAAEPSARPTASQIAGDLSALARESAPWPDRLVGPGAIGTANAAAREDRKGRSADASERTAVLSPSRPTGRLAIGAPLPTPVATERFRPGRPPRRGRSALVAGGGALLLAAALAGILVAATSRSGVAHPPPKSPSPSVIASPAHTIPSVQPHTSPPPPKGHGHGNGHGNGGPGRGHHGHGGGHGHGRDGD